MPHSIFSFVNRSIPNEWHCNQSIGVLWSPNILYMRGSSFHIKLPISSECINKIVIIKMGKDGCLVAYENRIEHVSIVPDTPVFDPTGAGDSFAGGLLGYISAYGLSDPVMAACYGTAVASYTVSGFGLENLLTMNHSSLMGKINQIEVIW